MWKGEKVNKNHSGGNIFILQLDFPTAAWST